MEVASQLTKTLHLDNRKIFMQNLHFLLFYQALSLASPFKCLSSLILVRLEAHRLSFSLDPALIVNWVLNILLASNGYLQWESWSACPDVCGVRYHQVRRRTCRNPTTTTGGADCSGVKSETRPTGCYTACLGRLSELFWSILSEIDTWQVVPAKSALAPWLDFGFRGSGLCQHSASPDQRAYVDTKRIAGENLWKVQRQHSMNQVSHLRILVSKEHGYAPPGDAARVILTPASTVFAIRS